MKKLIFLLFTTLVAYFVVAFYIVPLTKNWDSYGQEFTEIIESATGRKFQIEGAPQFSAFPFPSVKFGNVKLHSKDPDEGYVLTAKSAEIRPSIVSMLMLDVHPGHIAFGSPTLEYMRKEEKEVTRKEIISLDVLTFAASSRSGPFDIRGRGSDTEGIPFSFSIDTDNLSDGSGEVDFQIKSSTSNIEVNGNIDNWPQSPELQGKIEGDFNMLSIFPGRYIDFADGGSVINLKIPQHISIAEEGEIAGNLSLSASHFTIQNLTVDFPSLKGSGNITVNYGTDEQLTSNINIENINLDKMVGGSSIAEQHSKFVIPTMIDLNFKINVANITYNRQSIEKIQSDISRKKGIWTFDNLNIVGIPGEISIQGTGKILTADDGGNEKQLALQGDFNGKGNSLLPLLNWLQYDMSGIPFDLLDKSFNIDSDIVFYPEKLHVRELKLYRPDIDINSQFVIQKNEKYNIKAAFQVDNLDLNERVESLKHKTKNNDNTEKNSEEDEGSYNPIALLDKINSIRGLEEDFEKFSISFSADKMAYNSETFEPFSVTVSLEGGALHINRLEFSSQNVEKFLGKAKLDDKDLTPFVAARIRVGKFNTKFIDNIFETSLDELLKIDMSAGQGNEPHHNLEGAKKFAFLNYFSGAIAVEAGELTHNDISFDKLDTKLTFDAREIKVEKFVSGLFGGKLDLRAIITPHTSPASVTLSYTALNLELRDLLRNFYGLQNPAGGALTSNGNIVMVGYSPVQMAKAVKGVGNVAIRNLTIPNLDLEAITQKVHSYRSVKELTPALDKAFSGGGSKFSYLSGSMVIKDGGVGFKDMKFSDPKLTSDSIAGGGFVPLNSAINIKLYMKAKSRIGNIPVYSTITGTIDKPEIKWEQEKIEKFWEKYFYATQQ